MFTEFEKMEKLLSFTALMQAYGFVLTQNGHAFIFEYASGSISNYRKIKIFRPNFMKSSFDEDKEYLVAFFTYEDFSESGEWECDHHTLIEKTMTDEQIIKFLKEKGFKTNAERNQEREDREKEIRERFRK